MSGIQAWDDTPSMEDQFGEIDMSVKCKVCGWIHPAPECGSADEGPASMREGDGVTKLPDNFVEWHPGVSGSEESIALIPKDQVPREEYGPHMKMARAIVAEYQKNWEEFRDESRNTDIWSVAEDILRLRIAEAIARAVRAAILSATKE